MKAAWLTVPESNPTLDAIIARLPKTVEVSWGVVEIRDHVVLDFSEGYGKLLRHIEPSHVPRWSGHVDGDGVCIMEGDYFLVAFYGDEVHALVVYEVDGYWRIGDGDFDYPLADYALRYPKDGNIWDNTVEFFGDAISAF